MTTKQHRAEQHAQAATLFEQLIPGFTEALAHLKRSAEQITSLNGVHTSGIQPRPLMLDQVSGAAASQRISTSAGTLRGWSLREVAGGNAVVRLRSGQDANGDLLLTFSLAPGESTRDFPTHGIAYANGLYVEVVSGAVEGTLFIGPVGA